MAIEAADYPSAALRHLRDAEHLAASGDHHSPDQAWHLAGFAVECGRKAFLRDGWIAKLLGHDFQDAGELVLQVALALDPRAGRFPIEDWSARAPAMRSWRPDHRYERTGAVARDRARDLAALLTQARELLDQVLLALALEGSLALEPGA